MLFVKTQGALTIIKIIQLTPTSIINLFKMSFLDDLESEMGESELEDGTGSNTASQSPIFTATDLQASTTDALRRYYGSQTMEQALRTFENQKQIIEIDNDE